MFKNLRSMSLKDLRAKAKDDQGFTLIEVMIVVIIIGILAAVVMVKVQGASADTQLNACKADLGSIDVAQEAYFARNASYGTADQLVSQNLLKRASNMNDIKTATATAYTTAPAGKCVGLTYAS